MTSQSWCLQLCPCPQKSACKMSSGPILLALFNDLNSVTVCSRDEIQMVQERRHYGDIWYLREHKAFIKYWCLNKDRKIHLFYHVRLKLQ